MLFFRETKSNSKQEINLQNTNTNTQTDTRSLEIEKKNLSNKPDRKKATTKELNKI